MVKAHTTLHPPSPSRWNSRQSTKTTKMTKLLCIVSLLCCPQMSCSLLSTSGVASETISAVAKHTLYDSPVSNNGARCRLILYKKEIPASEVAIVSPTEIGGLKSEAYIKVNPQQKMPSLICTETGLCLAESDTIARYLLKEYEGRGPSFDVDNPRSNLICRIHDIYLTTIQGAMYKATGPFGVYGSRKSALNEYQRQLQLIDDLIVADSSYLCDGDITLADVTVFPSCVFAAHMLPKFGISPALPSKLNDWYEKMKSTDLSFARVFNEISGAIEIWESNDRWENILGAGWQDSEPKTIFDRIMARDIAVDLVCEDDAILAFKDVNPAAPAHVIIIPKDRMALTRLQKAKAEHVEILGKLMIAAAEISRDESLGFGDGARIVINDGPDGGQEVMHLHIHVLGGRKMGWPPG